MSKAERVFQDCLIAAIEDFDIRLHQVLARQGFSIMDGSSPSSVRRVLRLAYPIKVIFRL